MDRVGVRRFVYLSMLGVGDSGKQLGFVDRYIVVPILLRNVVTRSRKRGRPHQTKHVGLGDRTSGAIDERAVHGKISKRRGCQGKNALGVHLPSDVADFMVKQFTDDRYVHRTPAVLG